MKTVWKFTNQRELNKFQFLDYIERKVFRTIRKYQMIPKDKIIILTKSRDFNTVILKKIIETKFQVEISTNPNLSSDNLSQVAEDIFKNILEGNFKFQISNSKSPLLYLSDEEIELYTKLKNIKGTKRKQDKKIQTLFGKFLKKNQDIELNIIKAHSQLNGNK